MMDRNEALAALGAMDEAKVALARAADCPPWRHAAFGAVMGAIVLSGGVGMPLQSALFVAAMAGTVALVVNDRKRMGVFVNGYRRGKTLWVSLALLAAMCVAFLAEFRMRDGGAPIEPRIAVALAAALVAVAASVMWQRIFVRELGLKR